MEFALVGNIPADADALAADAGASPHVHWLRIDADHAEHESGR